MQVGTHQTTTGPAGNYSAQDSAASQEKQRYAQYKIIRRNGAVVSFEPGKISVAVTNFYNSIY